MKLLQANRDLALAKVIIEIAAQVFGFSVMIIRVLIDRTIWALVAGGLSSSVARTLLSHAWLPGTANSWQWNRAAFGEIVGFGKWIFLSSVLYFLVSNGDRIFLGGVIDATSLGTYAIAFLIFSSVDQVLVKIVVDVSFPALSEIARDQSVKLTETYYKFHAIIASVAYFCCGVLMVSGQAIIELLYDQRYQQAGWILEILAVALLSLPFRLTTQCFLALGLGRKFLFSSSRVAIPTGAAFYCSSLGFSFVGLAGCRLGNCVFVPFEHPGDRLLCRAAWIV